MRFFSKLVETLDYQDCATSYVYALISLHHDVMWWMAIILGFVFICLLKILDEFGWNWTKPFSVFFLVYRTDLLILESLFLFFILKYCAFLYKAYYKFLLFINDRLFLLSVTKSIKSDKFYQIILTKIELGLFKKLRYLVGAQYKTGFISFNSTEQDILSIYDSEEILDLIQSKYLTYLLYAFKPSAYFYDNSSKIVKKKNFFKTLAFSHSLLFEYVFAGFPTIIIAIILLPSLYLLYSIDAPIEPVLAVIIIGHQWYWSYEVKGNIKIKEKKTEFFQKTNDQDIFFEQTFKLENPITWLDRQIWFSYDSIPIQEKDLIFGGKRLLEVSKPLYVPIGLPIRFLITSADVLHSWAIPEFGIKTDAVPGRLNQVITTIYKPGFFFGQCSELCGVAHYYMPIAVEAMPLNIFLDLSLLESTNN